MRKFKSVYCKDLLMVHFCLIYLLNDLVLFFLSNYADEIQFNSIQLDSHFGLYLKKEL